MLVYSRFDYMFLSPRQPKSKYGIRRHKTASIYCPVSQTDRHRKWWGLAILFASQVLGEKEHSCAIAQILS